MFLLLHGADEFTTRESLDRMVHDPRFAYNVERFDGATADLHAVRLACETLPFLSEARLVVVEGLPKPRREGNEKGEASDPPPAEAEAPGGKGKKGAKKPTAAALAREFAGGLADLAAHLPPSTMLAVWVAEELPKAHALVLAAAQYGKTLLAAPRTGTALDQWIVAHAKAEGASIAPDVAHLLAEWTTGNIRLLASEIAKLATYAGPGGAIDRAAIQLLVADNREARVFDLTDALGRGERPQALRLLHELLDAGEAPLMILSMIVRQVRVLAQVGDLARRGSRAPEIAQAVGLPPFIVEKTLAQARRFTPAQIDAALRACLEVDTTLKRSRLAPELALDLLVTEFGRSP